MGVVEGIEVPTIPDRLREDLAFNLGEAEAVAWLESAVDRARMLIEAWDLRPDEVLPGGSMSLCIKCTDPEGDETVLKIPAGQSDGASEIAALKAWGGNGAAKVLREDPDSSAMLMNFLGRVGCGSYGLDDIVDLADRLHRADFSGFGFGTVDDNLARRIAWATERFDEPGYERHQADLAIAEKLVLDLTFSTEPQVLLHGDLQAKNLIVHGDELTAVDPLPVLGPAAFDLAFWIAKSIHEHAMVTYVERVAALRPDLDAEVLLRWTWALAVLENRPYLEPGRQQRQDFIDGLRDTVADWS